MHRWLRALRDEVEGATAVEYAIIAGFIAAVCAAAVGLLGQGVNRLFASAVNF
jgi:Flp pilus assembly pilin Flp